MFVMVAWEVQVIEMFKIFIALCCVAIATSAVLTNTINNKMDMVRQNDIQEETVTIIPKKPEYAHSFQYQYETETTEHATTVLNEVETTLEETTAAIEEVRYVFNVTDYERELLARIVYLEANVESFDCQAAVTSVIFNRLLNGYWGDSIYDVLYAKNQFSPINRINYVTPNATNYAAVDYVIKNGCTLPYYVMYFRAGYHFQWSGYVPYTVIDDTYFGYMTSDK